MRNANACTAAGSKLAPPSLSPPPIHGSSFDSCSPTNETRFDRRDSSEKREEFSPRETLEKIEQRRLNGEIQRDRDRALGGRI